MKYLIERRNTKPGQIGIVLFVLSGRWRFNISLNPARSRYGWFWSAQIGRVRLNVERRTPEGFENPERLKPTGGHAIEPIA